MKYVVGLIIGVSTLLGFGGCSDKCAKVPLVVPVDFSKKGTVYETDFQAPWNIWGSLVEFYMSARMPDARFANDEENRISDYIRTGEYRDRDGKLIPTKETPYFKLKVTLTPLGLASDDVTIWTQMMPGTSFVSQDSRKEFTDGHKIEFVATVPLYGGGFGKTIMIADLQRLRNYHIRVESLEDIELPKGAKNYFFINRASRKY